MTIVPPIKSISATRSLLMGFVVAMGLPLQADPIWEHPNVLVSLPPQMDPIVESPFDPHIMEVQFPQMRVWLAGETVGYFSAEWRAPIWTVMATDFSLWQEEPMSTPAYEPPPTGPTGPGGGNPGDVPPSGGSDNPNLPPGTPGTPSTGGDPENPPPFGPGPEFNPELSPEPPAAEVPEPGAFALAGLGLLLSAVITGRRK
jgi:hypothetical protein